MKIENVAVIPLEEYEEFAKWKQLKDKPVIDYDRLRTGSIVKIKRTGQHCCGIESINESDPVTILLYKSNGYMYNNKFMHNEQKYITFIQGKYICHFTTYKIDYITEVINY